MVSSIKKNFIYNILYQVLTMIIPLITTPYISRILGSEGVGRYSYAYAIAYYFSVFAMLGVNNYGNRTIAAISYDRKERSKVFWSIYSLQLFVSVITIVLYILYVLFWGKDKIIEWIMLIYIISSALDINWFFFGMEQFKVTIIRNSLVKLLTVIFIFLFVRTSEDVYIYAFVSVFGMLFSQSVLWLMLREYVSFEKISICDILPHIKPNLILFIPVIAISLYKFMDKIMLGIMSSNVEVGYYESCEKIMQIPIALITALGTVMLPRISNMLAKKQQEESLYYIRKSLVLTIAISAPMSFGIMAIAKEFVPIFYGPGFDKCVDVFQVLLPSCIFSAFASVIRTQYLIPHKNDNVYIVSVFCGALVNFVINALLIPRYQSVGAAIGTLFAEGVVCIVQGFYIKKQINILKYVIYSLPFLVISIFMYCVLRTLDFSMLGNFFALILKVVIGVFIYMICSGFIVCVAKRKSFILK